MKGCLLQLILDTGCSDYHEMKGHITVRNFTRGLTKKVTGSVAGFSPIQKEIHEFCVSGYIT